MSDVSELRTRLGVGAEHVSDEALQRCLDVAFGQIEGMVPAENLTHVLFGEAQMVQAITVYTNAVRSVPGADQAGDITMDVWPTIGVNPVAIAYLSPIAHVVVA